MLAEIAKRELVSILIRHSVGMSEYKCKEKLHSFCSRRFKKPEVFFISNQKVSQPFFQGIVLNLCRGRLRQKCLLHNDVVKCSTH